MDSTAKNGGGSGGGGGGRGGGRGSSTTLTQERQRVIHGKRVGGRGAVNGRGDEQRAGCFLTSRNPSSHPVQDK